MTLISVLSFALMALWLGLIAVGIIQIAQRRRIAGAVCVLEGVLAIAAQIALTLFPVGIGTTLIRISQRTLSVVTFAALAAVAVTVLITRRGITRRLSLATRAERIAGLVLAPVLAAGTLWGLSYLSTPDREREHDAVKRGIELSAGFQAELYARGTLDNPTVMTFGPDGALYVADITGKLWKIEDKDHTGASKAITKLGSGFQFVLGLVWYKDELYIGSAGKVEAYHVRDGTLVDKRVVVDKLPSMVYLPHSNNALTLGPDSRIYFGVGSTVGSGEEPNPLASAILSVSPDGGPVKVVARGLGNPFEVGFNKSGQMFSGDNPPDLPDGSPAPDAFHEIVQGGDYSLVSKDPLKSPRQPLVEFPEHSTPTGLVFYEGKAYPPEYVDNAFVALWNRGEIARMVISKDARGQTRVDASRFAAGFLYPIALANGPDGDLYVADFGTKAIYRIVYTGK